MKRTIILGLLFLFTTSAIYAQGWKRKKKKDQKIYVSTFINMDLHQILSYVDEPFEGEDGVIVDQFGTILPGIQRNIQSDSETIGIGFSIQKLKNNNKYTEFSLTKFRLQRHQHVNFFILESGNVIEPFSGDEKINFEFASRYEYGSYLNLGLESRWRIGMAGGIAPYFSIYRTSPATSASFPRKFTRYGLKLEFVPSISFRCSKNGFIDFKWSPSIFDFNRNHVYTQNPILTRGQRKQTYTIPSFFQTPLSFQLHYRHEILGKRASKKAFRKKKKNDDEEQSKKKSAIYVNPIVNIYTGKEDLSHQFTFSRGEVDTLSNFIEIKPLINVGIGFQFVKENGFYTEFSLTRFNRKQAFNKEVIRYADVPNFSIPTEISETGSKEFSIASRFEMGVIFGNLQKAKVMVSLGMGIEPFYYSHKITEGTQVANIGAALKIIPALSFKLSHRINFHMRWTPSVYSGYKQTFVFNDSARFLPIENDPWNFQWTPNLSNCNVGFRVRVF